MKLGIMQPYFFPYLGYFQLIQAVDKFIFYDDVNFIKGGWVNRNRLLVNSSPSFFNAGTLGASPFKLINQIELDPNRKWRDRILKAIQSSYGKAPYFKEVFPLLEELIKVDTLLLSEFNINSVRGVMNFLSLTTNTEISSLSYNNNELRGITRVLDICRENQAAVYINPIGGQELYNKKAFAEAGIKLNFIQMSVVDYKQFGSEFVGHLSILDVLMFNEKQAVQKLLTNYTLL